MYLLLFCPHNLITLLCCISITCPVLYYHLAFALATTVSELIKIRSKTIMSQQTRASPNGPTMFELMKVMVDIHYYTDNYYHHNYYQHITYIIYIQPALFVSSLT